MLTICVGIIGACWGSFLNVVAHRAIAQSSLRGRSRCIQCNHILHMHHLIPIISWLYLRGMCSYCKSPISWWYPAIECTTMLWCIGVVLFQEPLYWPTSLLFGSGMIITMRTDGEHLLILNAVTRYGAIIALLAAVLGYAPISIAEASAGGIIGFSILAITQIVFSWLRGYEGLGWGDVELLGAIGTFVGPYGVWLTLLLGSVTGSIYGMLIALRQHHQYRSIKLPFGLFLAAAGMITYLYGTQIIWHTLAPYSHSTSF